MYKGRSRMVSNFIGTTNHMISKGLVESIKRPD